MVYEDERLERDGREAEWRSARIKAANSSAPSGSRSVSFFRSSTLTDGKRTQPRASARVAVLAVFWQTGVPKMPAHLAPAAGSFCIQTKSTAADDGDNSQIGFAADELKVQRHASLWTLGNPWILLPARPMRRPPATNPNSGAC